MHWGWMVADGMACGLALAVLFCGTVILRTMDRVDTKGQLAAGLWLLWVRIGFGVTLVGCGLLLVFKIVDRILVPPA